MSEFLTPDSPEKRLAYAVNTVTPHLRELYRYARARANLEVAGLISSQGVEFLPDLILLKDRVNWKPFFKNIYQRRAAGEQGKIFFHFHALGASGDPSYSDIVNCYAQLSQVVLKHGGYYLSYPDEENKRYYRFFRNNVTVMVPKEVLPVDSVLRKWEETVKFYVNQVPLDKEKFYGDFPCAYTSFDPKLKLQDILAGQDILGYEKEADNWRE